MLITEASVHEATWNHLQEPACAGRVTHSHQRLLAALDSGWEIEEPVYLRARWGAGGPRVYHFILNRPHFTPHLISVPESAEIKRFVRDEGLWVIA